MSGIGTEFRDTIKRPSTRVQLKSLSYESMLHAKTQLDPTEDLIEVSSDFITTRLEYYQHGFCIFCKDTMQMWFAPTEECLNRNFIYREDLLIQETTSYKEVEAFWTKYLSGSLNKITPRKSCYIMDIPMNETYEVYYESNYPSQRYGKSTPQGSYIHKYPNRFHRDMAILALDNLYSNSSMKEAGKFIGRDFEENEAIIISDGAWIKGKIASSVFYLDADTTLQLTEGSLPSVPDHGSLIAEIKAATLALSMCCMKKKTKVTYYYDNKNILNVLGKTKVENVTEIQEYRSLCEKLYHEGFVIKFVELHPKTGENRDKDNKALMFFHNQCDAACVSMCDLVHKDYKKFAVNAKVESAAPLSRPRSNRYNNQKNVQYNRTQRKA